MALFEGYLYKRKSQLPNAGKGLFTRISIPKGRRVVEYKGKVRLWKEMRPLDGHNAYLMKINRRLVVDAQFAVHTFGRYSNDADGSTRKRGLENNCEYVSDGIKCYLESIRRIRKGEEILVGYGKQFWKLHEKIQRNRQNK